MSATDPSRVSDADLFVPADPGEAAPRLPGRPRGPSAATQYAILSTSWRILADEGITALTPTRLHAETGVARTTIYRHWPNPASVVADIVAGTAQRRNEAAPTGDISADLIVAVEALTFRLRHRPVAALLVALRAGEAQLGPEAPSATDYVNALLEPIREVIAHGIDRGALHPAALPDVRESRPEVEVDQPVASLDDRPTGSEGPLAEDESGRSTHETGGGAATHAAASNPPVEVETSPLGTVDVLLHELVGPLLLRVVLLGHDPGGVDDRKIVDRFLTRHAAPSAGDGTTIEPAIEH